MMRHRSPVLFLLVVSVNAGRRTFHRLVQANYYFMEISTEIRIGTPEVEFTARLDTTIPHFVIMDAACHEPQQEYRCPRFCKDSVAKLIFCSPLCDSVSHAEAKARCFRPNLYYSNSSATFHDLREEVSSTFRSTRPLHGRLAKDQVSLITQRVEKAQNYESSTELWSAIETKNLEFVRGFSYDLSKLYGMSAILGLSPKSPTGHRSLIPQLKSAGIMQRAILTIQKPNPPLLMTPYQYVQTHYSMTMGALDGYHCRQWRSFPTYDGFDWNFAISSVTLFGKRINGPNVGRIDLAESYIEVPAQVVAHFVAENLITVANDTQNLYLTEEADPKKVTMEFTVGNQRISMDPRWLRPYPESLILTMKAGESFRYTDEPRWGFGIDLLKYLCFGYDYDGGAVLWAERRIIRVNREYGDE